MYVPIGLATKWSRILSIEPDDRFRNHLVANPIEFQSLYYAKSSQYIGSSILQDALASQSFNFLESSTSLKRWYVRTYVRGRLIISKPCNCSALFNYWPHRTLSASFPHRRNGRDRVVFARLVLCTSPVYEMKPRGRNRHTLCSGNLMIRAKPRKDQRSFSWQANGCCSLC